MKRLRSSGTVSAIDPSGGTHVLRQITDMLRGIQSDVSQIITEYNTEVYPVIATLPQGKSENRWRLTDDNINPRINGLDGTNVFVDIDATSESDGGRFWYSAGGKTRPKTIKESLLALHTSLTTVSDQLRSEIDTTNAGNPIAAYNTSPLAGNIVEDDVRSIVFDGTTISATSSGTGVITVTSAGGGGGGTDANAIHDNVASEISAITAKATPTASDILLIEDAADSNSKKKITLSSLLGKFSPAIVVGNALAGDTISDCDYLDTGNGANLETAILAADSDHDVYIRPGTYNFNSSGGPTAPISIPTGVRVRGAGSYHTVITPYDSDPRAFIMGDWDCTLEDLYIYLNDDATGAITQTTIGSVIQLGRSSTCKNIIVDYESSWATWDPTKVKVYSSFTMPAALIGGNSYLEGCKSINTPILGGTGPTNTFVRNISNAGSLNILNCSADGGDNLILATSRIKVTSCDLTGGTATSPAISLSTSKANESSIRDCRISISGAAGQTGIDISSSDRISITSNWIEATAGASGCKGIVLASGRYGIISNNSGPGDSIGGAGWQTAITLDASSTYTNVVGNNFYDTVGVTLGNYIDAGVGNNLSNNL